MKLKRDSNGNFKLHKRFIPAQQKRFCRMDQPVKKQEKENRFLLSTASQNPVWRSAWQCWEKMLINEDALDLSWLSQGRAALLFNHDPYCLIGKNEEIFIRDKVLYSEARIKPGEYLEDVKGGYLSNVSVGYEILEASLEESEDGEDILVIDRARILEISLVSIPADFSTQVEQSLPDKNQPEDEEETSPEEKERSRVAGIVHLSKREDIPDWRRDRAIQSGEPIENFISYVEGQRGEPQPVAAPAPVSNRTIGGNMNKTETLYAPNERDRAGNGLLGLSKKELGQYSIARLLANQCNLQLDKPANFEQECSQEIARRSGRQPRGSYVPFDVLTRNSYLSTGTSGGGSMVATEVTEPVEFLRSRSVLALAGGTFLEGLTSEVSVPRQNEGANTAWLSEGSVIPIENVGFDPLNLRPHSLGAIVYVTRRLLQMASASVSLEQFILRDIGNALTTALQRAALVGSESSNEPEGIIANGSVPTVDAQGNSLTYDDVLALEASVSSNNIPLEGMAVIAHPQGIRQLRGISKDTGSGEFLLGDEANAPDGSSGMVLSYPAYATTSMPENKIVLGQFSDLLMATFGNGIDLDVNPYETAAFSQNLVACRGIMEADLGLRRVASFGVLENFSIS